MKMQIKKLFVASVTFDGRNVAHVSFTRDERFAMHVLPDHRDPDTLTKAQMRMRDKIERALGYSSWVIRFVR